MARIDRGKLDDALAAMFSGIEFRGTYLFYAHLVAQCSIKIDYNLPAAAGVAFMHDHYELYVNPDLFDDYDLHRRLGVIKHEMLHIMFDHVRREETRDHDDFNYATDCAINQMIDENHIDKIRWITPQTLSKDLGVHVPKNENSETYYEIVHKNKKKNGKNNKNGSRLKPGGDHGSWRKSEGEKDFQNDVTKRMIEKAQDETVKGAGTIPTQCSDWLDLFTNKAEVNWKRVLHGITGNKRLNRRMTIMRRDRRMPHREELRGKTKDRIFNLLVIADVSGSMSNKAVVTTLGEVRHICDATNSDVDLIQVDSYAYEPEKLTKKTKVITRKGCGGTTLHWALDMAKKHKLDYQAVVVLTDGGLFGNDIDYFQALKKKVIWLVEANGTIMPEMNTGRMKAFKLKNEVGKAKA